MKQEKIKATLFSLAVVGLLSCAVSAFLFPHLPLVWQISLGVALVSLAAAVWIARADLKVSFGRRTVRYGMNSLFMTFVALAITVVVNLIANNHDFKIDLTKNKLHTLSDQSLKVVGSLKQDVTLRAFVQPLNRDAVNRILDKYASRSNRIKVVFVDVDREPGEVRKYNVKHPGTIVVESGARNSTLEGLNAEDGKIEEKITNAIIGVVKGTKRKIYFVNGHGERRIDDNTREGLTSLRDTLGSGRYAVEDLNLIEKDTIPKDAEILVVPGARKEWMNLELTQLEKYIRTGGKVLFLMEPDASSSLTPFLAKFGVEWKAKKVAAERDPRHVFNGNPLWVVVSRYQQHEITRDASGPSLMQEATTVEKSAKPPEGLSITPLLGTSPAGLEISMTAKGYNPKPDRAGAMNLGVAVSGKVQNPGEKPAEPKAGEEAPKLPEFRVVVIGDSDFVANDLLGKGFNTDLVQNSLSWLAQEEDLISIRPRSTDESNLDITDLRMKLVVLASMGLVPLLMFGSAFTVWWTRKRK